MCLDMQQSSSWRLSCALALVWAALGGALVAAPVMASQRPAATAALPHVAERIETQARLRIVAFGSSSTEGVGASSPATTYPSRLAAYLRARLPNGVQVINAGIGGEDADDMLRRLPGVIAQHPDLVIWQTGSNDPLRGLPLPRFEAETRAGIQAMRQAGIDVMLMEQQYCGVLQATAGSLAYRDALRRIGAELGVPVVRRFDLMQQWLAQGLLKPGELMSGDNLHMADGGYALLAIAVGEQIIGDAGTAAAVTAGR
jgi:lysophospholipase L1-like esterase